MSNQRYAPEQLAKIIYGATERVKLAHIYRHKRGGLYIAVGVTLREEDLEPLVIYTPTDPKALGFSISFVRPLAEFLERFSLEPQG